MAKQCTPPEFADDPQHQATHAVQQLTAALADGGITLPSLGVDWPLITGAVLVSLGRARPDVVLAIVALLREGLNARVQQQS